MSDEAQRARVWAVPRVFSGAECEAIVAAGEALGLSPGMIRAGPEHRQRVLDRSYRHVDLVELPATPELAWVGARLLAVADQVGEALALQPSLSEPLVLLRYGVGGHYKPHTDANTGVIAGRRLSLIVQLSDPADYEGGAVELIEAKRWAERGRGDVTAFPSDQLHAVHPLTAGQRYALVAWVWGEAR